MFILIYKIENKIVRIDEYIQIKIFILNSKNRKNKIKFFIIKAYIVNNLKINILININNLKS